MILITEDTFDVKPIIESTKDGAKSYYITGPFLVSEQPNRNGRFYPRPVLEKEVNAYRTLISEKRAISELGHPDTPNINLERVSHLITDLKFNPHNVVEGRAKILDTPYGKIAKNLLDEGVKLGVSSRGMGSIKEGKDGINVVQEDFKLAAIDIVSDPSGPGCFVQGMMENKQWVLDAFTGKWDLLENSQKRVQAVKQKDLEAMEIAIFENILRKL